MARNHPIVGSSSPRKRAGSPCLSDVAGPKLAHGLGPRAPLERKILDADEKLQVLSRLVAHFERHVIRPQFLDRESERQLIARARALIRVRGLRACRQHVGTRVLTRQPERDR